MRTAGRDGSYTLTINVVSDAGGPVSGWPVRISDSQSSEVEDISTDEWGVVTHRVSFSGFELWVEVVVLGTTLQEKLRLWGPRQKQWRAAGAAMSRD